MLSRCRYDVLYLITTICSWDSNWKPTASCDGYRLSFILCLAANATYIGRCLARDADDAVIKIIIMYASPRFLIICAVLLSVFAARSFVTTFTCVLITSNKFCYLFTSNYFIFSATFLKQQTNLKCDFCINQIKPSLFRWRIFYLWKYKHNSEHCKNPISVIVG